MNCRNTFAWVIVVGLLFATVSCGEAAGPQEGDPKDESFGATLRYADALGGVEENSPEARAILEVVNTFSLHKLVREVDLYYRAAHHIIIYRNGPDGVRNTADDRFMRSMAELDAVPYIGKSSLTRLVEYVDDVGLVEDHAIVYSAVIPELINTKRTTAFRGEIGTRQLIRVRLEGNLGDRVIMWLRKASDAQWNPRIEVIDSSSGDKVTYANPWGNTDARLPYDDDDASFGWELERDGTGYTIILDNVGKVDGEFEFTLECVGGPCLDGQNSPVLNGDFGNLTDGDLREQMVARHELTHTYMSYYQAREIMFSSLDNDSGEVECVYTGERVKTSGIPSNLEMNAEHTWPQSRGAVDGAARSDLHHLFPVTNVVNSVRAAYEYCEVDNVLRDFGGAYYGTDRSGRRCFEPRDEHKGNAARAMFYFASVYQQKIEPWEEVVLREWHRADPVDASELSRNGEIEMIQGSRNYFVDEPELVDRIGDF